MSNRYIPKNIRDQVIVRAFGRCEYCQSYAHNSIHTFPIDHVIPLEKGGLTVLANLAYSCGGCNGFKTDKVTETDPLSKKQVNIYNPRTQRWLEHFAWSNDYLEIIGLTPFGRATIIRLKLNRTGLKNMRKLTILSGEHPPMEY